MKGQPEKGIFNDSSPYADIMNQAPKNYSGHRRMEVRDRAAQFAPYAALKGYGALLDKISHRYRHKHYLSWQERRQLLEQIKQAATLGTPRIVVNAFDSASGYYIEHRGRLSALDWNKVRLEMIATEEQASGQQESRQISFPLASIDKFTLLD